MDYEIFQSILIILLCIGILYFMFSAFNTTYQEIKRPSLFCDCKNDMMADNSFISDTCDENGDNHVIYKCKSCGREHDYNFDIALVPVSWKDINEQRQSNGN